MKGVLKMHGQLICEDIKPIFWMSGEFDVLELSAPTPPVGQPEGNPTSIIQLTQDWGVRVRWQTHGDLNYVLCLQWEICILLEKWGPEEFGFPPGVGCSGLIRNVQQPHAYETIIKIPKRCEGLKPGNYELAVAVQSFTIDVPPKPGPLSCFGKAAPSMLRFWEPGK